MRLERLTTLAWHFVLLMAFWLIMSGMFDAFHVVLGVISVIIVIAVNYRIIDVDQGGDESETTPRLKVGRFLLFLPYLLWKITTSSLRVALLAVHPAMPTKTVVFTFRVSLPNVASRVLLANSITLTPGTVTLELTAEGRFVVHALFHEKDDEVMDHSLLRAIAWIYGVDASFSDETILFKKGHW